MAIWVIAFLTIYSSKAVAQSQAGPADAPSHESLLMTEEVYVESTTDTDSDGRPDRIYVKISRPSGQTDLPSIMTITPYAFGGNASSFHDVDLARLPQDRNWQGHQKLSYELDRFLVRKEVEDVERRAWDRGYASVSAHSVGTGRSTGCPTVGDMAETLGAKAVIDWLNGRARAFSGATGSREVTASWSNGNVGMTGVSYNGTLPNMVATTGVEGLKAIVPVAAISSWYDYYRAHGLVVGPGGYVGEDADVLGRFIVRRGACRAEISQLADEMGREHGDFTSFWQDRDYISRAAGVSAAVFIVHGQSDWNVRQRHAIRWWHALQGSVPLRMWLHSGGHSTPRRSNYQAQVWAWFDHFVKGVDNGVGSEPAVEVQYPDGRWVTQSAWPHPDVALAKLHFNDDFKLAETPTTRSSATFVDRGRSQRVAALARNPDSNGASHGRLIFLSDPLTANKLLSGTPQVQLTLALTNRYAANITVAVVEYDRSGRVKVVTRGWADPQNHVLASMSAGESLVPGAEYQLLFELEPKQSMLSAGSRIGVLVSATDYDHTIRPQAGTEVSVALGADSFIELPVASGSL